jgi:NADPH:quinone reductase-like Zn-dependent oxidoreductase
MLKGLIMKAVIYTKYGPPEVLQIKEVGKPIPKDNEVLIKIHATTVNRTDNATIRAIPFFARIITGLLRPKIQIPGTEFAGKVEAIGENASSFKIGDRVFGFEEIGSKSHAQYLTIKETKAITTIPDNISYEQAAASSEGAHYAYNFINKVDLKPGQKILVNGATGAIGSAAVQLLIYFGADVDAVCNTKNIDLVKSLGANKIYDYEKEDFTKTDHKYNYVFDTVGKSSFFKCKRLLLPGGVYISSDLGYMWQNMFMPPITKLFNPLLENKKTLFPVPSDTKGSILLIKKLIEEGKFKSIIDKKYPLEQIVDAYKYVGTGQKTGNVVISVEHNS